MKRLVLMSMLALTVLIVSLTLARAKEVLATTAGPATTTDDCTQWCSATEPSCPPMVCMSPATLDTACKQAACQLYKSTCLGCDAAACNSCLDEQARHDQALQDILNEAHAGIAACDAREEEWGQEYVHRCEQYWNDWYTAKVGYEADIHAAALYQLALTNVACKNAAFTTYSATNCCVEQH